MSMLMSLNAGEIDEMELPEVVGLYVLNSRPDCKITCVLRPLQTPNEEKLAFGFLKGRGEALRDRFNEALDAMEQDGTLAMLTTRYLKIDGEPESVTLPSFEGAEKIIVAVTGDLPPIDYVAADGNAAGFNAALLAEISKRLKINIRLNYVNTGSRSATLTSGRSDVVFWYQFEDGAETQYDIPDTVILSRPFYNWAAFVHIGKKD